MSISAQLLPLGFRPAEVSRAKQCTAHITLLKDRQPETVWSLKSSSQGLWLGSVFISVHVRSSVVETCWGCWSIKMFEFLIGYGEEMNPHYIHRSSSDSSHFGATKGCSKSICNYGQWSICFFEVGEVLPFDQLWCFNCFSACLFCAQIGALKTETGKPKRKKGLFEYSA